MIKGFADKDMESIFEHLQGDRLGQVSIRINDHYRICFKIINSDCYDVEIVDYH